VGLAGGRAAERPLALGFAGDQRWTLGRIKTLIGKLFHVGYTPEGVWKLMRRHGWSCQVPVRQALERDEDAVAVWKAEVWPEIRGRRPGEHRRDGVLPARGPAAPVSQAARVPPPQGRAEGVHLGQDYRDLIIAAHRSLSAPLIWCWDNLNVHLAPELAEFAAENKAWLRVYRLPA